MTTIVCAQYNLYSYIHAVQFVSCISCAPETVVVTQPDQGLEY